jgi:hypothetical protein
MVALRWQSDNVVAKPFLPLGSSETATDIFFFKALRNSAVSRVLLCLQTYIHWKSRSLGLLTLK